MAYLPESIRSYCSAALHLALFRLILLFFGLLQLFFFHIAQTLGCVCLLLCSLLFLHYLLHGRSKYIPDTSHLKNVKTILSRSFFLTLPLFLGIFLIFPSNLCILSTCAPNTNTTTITNRHQSKAVLGAQRPLETTHGRSTYWSVRRYLDLRRQ